MSVFPFIEAEKAEQGNVTKACQLLEVSRSAFYEWSEHTPSARPLADAELGQRIQAIYHDSRSTYGWPRMHRALRREGVHASRKRVARIMRQRGLIGRWRRRWTPTGALDVVLGNEVLAAANDPPRARGPRRKPRARSDTQSGSLAAAARRASFDRPRFVVPVLFSRLGRNPNRIRPAEHR